jgi:two-component system response regulator HydG
VLFIGETGTGKELLARLLHDASPRRDGPFFTVNCSATPPNVLEVELFGAVGAFDGGIRETSLERATGGTLFLDEIDALDLQTQARLAAVLRSGRLSREPGGREIPLNVRLVAASDRDLAQLASQGSFHEELLALLAMATIKIPPLHERSEDIPLFADHFLKLHARRMNRDVRRISQEALRMLTAYSWPGNVREISNVIERAVILCRGDEIGPELLPFTGDQAVTERELSLDHVEKIAILRALTWCQGKKGQAAKVLGISWPTLNKKIHDYGIEVPEKT